MVLSQDVLNWFYDPNTGKQAVDRDGNPKVTMESKFQLTFDYNNVYNNNNPVLPGDGDSQPAPGKTYRVDPIGIVSPSNNELFVVLPYGYRGGAEARQGKQRLHAA